METETLPRWAWPCVSCGKGTLEPHQTTVDDATAFCPACCAPCRTGETAVAVEQWVKENKTQVEPGDLIVGHGLPTREQAAWAEAAAAA